MKLKSWKSYALAAAGNLDASGEWLRVGIRISKKNLLGIREFFGIERGHIPPLDPPSLRVCNHSHTITTLPCTCPLACINHIPFTRCNVI